jgi:hypothetical protein
MPSCTLRAKLARFAADHFDSLRAANPEMPGGLSDRAEDCWRPLLAIADRAGGPWPRLAREAAVTLSRGVDEEDQASAGVQLLGHARELFAAHPGKPALTSSWLCQQLNANEAWPWAEWRRGRPLSVHGLAKLLGKFGIRPRKAHLAREYRAADFADAWQRYLPPPPPAAPVQPPQPPRGPETAPLPNGLMGRGIRRQGAAQRLLQPRALCTPSSLVCRAAFPADTGIPARRFQTPRGGCAADPLKV